MSKATSVRISQQVVAAGGRPGRVSRLLELVRELVLGDGWLKIRAGTDGCRRIEPADLGHEIHGWF